MKCVICRQGTTNQGHTTVTVQRGQSVVMFRGVPAEICDVCGEYYLAAAIAQEVERRANVALLSGAELEIQRFAA